MRETDAYPALARAKVLQAALTDAFGAAVVNRFTDMPVIGCCAEHERDFAWYRAHHWRDMPAAIAAKELDPFEISSLQPAVYFAFVPGLCLHVLRTVIDTYGRQDFARFTFDDWIKAGLFPMHPVAGAERHLSHTQRRCVADVLGLYDECLAEIAGYPATIELSGGRRSLREAIAERWGDPVRDFSFSRQ